MIFGHLRHKGFNRPSRNSKISKVDENNYVGLINELVAMNLRNEDTVKIKWNINSITIPEKQKEIKGKLEFCLPLNATESNTIK